MVPVRVYVLVHKVFARTCEIWNHMHDIKDAAQWDPFFHLLRNIHLLFGNIILKFFKVPKLLFINTILHYPPNSLNNIKV